ncbi:glycosyltransferase [Paenibacillus gansuensis]|uniref:Glycosyltransferase n=1 Tax=Paenibacillus gansuensis TaxID=306542 RepID=A0ABW5PCQ8_9BACL
MKTYLTALTTDSYLPGVLALHKSLLKTKPKYGFRVLVTENVSGACLSKLKRHRIDVMKIKRLPSMREKASESENRKRNNFSKILMFQLTEFEKIVYLDSDMMVMRNIDHLFHKPHMSAVPAGSLYPRYRHWTELNSGLLIVKPEKGLTEAIMAHLPKKVHHNYGDQKLLIAHYPQWSPKNPRLHLDHKYNMIIGTIDFHIRKHGYNVNYHSPDRRTVAVVHFIGPKPWLQTRKEQTDTIRSYRRKDKHSDADMLAKYQELLRSFR